MTGSDEATDNFYPGAPRLQLAAHETFDLTAGRPLRVRLFSRSPSDHVLLVVVHHIVSDGLSSAIFNRELSALYEAALAGADPDAVLPPLPVSFLDYAIWSRYAQQRAALRAPAAVLAVAPGRSGGTRPAVGPCAPRDPEAGRRRPRGQGAPRDEQRACDPRAAQRRNAVHGVDVGVARPAGPLRCRRRHCGRDSERRARPP